MPKPAPGEEVGFWNLDVDAEMFAAERAKKPGRTTDGAVRQRTR